jgi:hypothetical protein
LKLLKQDKDSSAQNRSAIASILLQNAITELEKDSLNTVSDPGYASQKELDDKSFFTWYFTQTKCYSTFSGKHKEENPEEALSQLKTL